MPNFEYAKSILHQDDMVYGQNSALEKEQALERHGLSIEISSQHS